MTKRHALAVLLATGGLAAPAAGQILFSDQTASAGVVAVHDINPDAIPGPQYKMVSGMAVGDFDLDGLPDMYFIGGGLAPDKLFMNNGDGTFTDRAADWGLTLLHTGAAAGVADYDDDGWPDLYVSSFGPPDQHNGEPGSHKLFRNNGDGTFTDVAVAAGVNQTSDFGVKTTASGVAWGDYDLDGHLDLMVAGWTKDSNGSRLFHANGDGTFSDVTETAIGESIVAVRGLQPAFADMDGDLYPELLMANDFGSSRYYRNEGDGTFTNWTTESGTGLDTNGMGQFVADVDNDGLYDWYVTSIYKGDPPIGNMLYMNLGGHLYEETSQVAGVDDGRWGWATLAVDLDHDGHQDIVEVNGWYSNWTIDQPPKLWRNNADGTFTEMAAAAGLTDTGQARGMVYLDVEGDGDLDLVITNNEEPPICYRNDSEDIGNWLQVDLDTSPNALLAPHGFGATVSVTAGPDSQIRLMNGAPSFLTTSELMVHFGVADATVIDKVRVFWPRGQVTVLEDVPANQRITVIAPVLGDIDADGLVSTADLLLLIAAWGAVEDPSDLAADLDADGAVATTDVLILLQNWGS